MLSRRLRRYYGHPRRAPVKYISSFSYAYAARALRLRQINREASEITTRTHVRGKCPECLAARRSSFLGTGTTDGIISITRRTSSEIVPCAIKLTQLKILNGRS